MNSPTRTRRRRPRVNAQSTHPNSVKHNSCWDIDTVRLQKLFDPDIFIAPPSPSLNELCCLFIRFFNSRKNEHQYAVFIKEKGDLRTTRINPTYPIVSLQIFCQKYKCKVTCCISFWINEGVVIRNTCFDMQENGTNLPIEDVIYEQILWILEENGIYAERDAGARSLMDGRDQIGIESLTPKLKPVVILPKINK
mmetsp:Transcript_25428/g.33202  ORF Transcript_25428/g.33202 Transcript_25428/m.33202 type:complete len:195 (-) Transcript_25428:165-749(-)